MKEAIHVGIIEDQLLFREGMKAILSNWPEIKIVLEASEGYTVQDKLTACVPQPNVLLVDLSLPSQGDKEFNGIHVTDMVVERFPAIKVLILSVHEDENFITQLIEHGAHGYLVKDCDPNEVHEAIQAVYTRGSYINERTLKALQNSLHHKEKAKSLIHGQVQLTKREAEILGHICHQLTTDEIANKLFISSKTVNGHRNNLLQKTGSRNTAGLVVYALKNQIIQVL